MLIDYPDVPRSVGRFEGDAFDPREWRPEYPNPAFDNMQPADAFWAARIVARFTPEAVRAIVEKAQYSDRRATDYMVETLLERREKVLRTWLNDVNPVVDPRLDASGRLTWRNAAMDAGVASAPESYSLRWFVFDNGADERRDVGDAQTARLAQADAPSAVLNGKAEYIGVVITATNPQQPAWAKPATFYFRRTGGAWVLVGAEWD
jgi:hypothetical protein